MKQLQPVIAIIRNGGIIAYPTEAVYGLGCDPFNHAAIKRLLQLKQRPASQGLILIAASWEQIIPLIKPLTPEQLIPAQQTWPGPVTWVFPASEQVPHWLRSHNHTIALRITAHPLARRLCELVNQPLISTSANLSGGDPCKTDSDVARLFGKQVDLIIHGKVGNLAKPTPIRDILSGDYLR